MNPELLAALIQAGLVTPADADLLTRALADPSADPLAARQWAENLLTNAAQTGLSAQQERLLDLLRQTEADPTPAELAAFWQGEDQALLAAMRPALVQVASERALTATLTGGGAFSLVNQRVIDWVDTHYIDPDGLAYGSIPNLNLTSRTQFARAFIDWNRGELGGRPAGLPQLIEALTPTFGPTRSEAIGITETTRVFIWSQRIAEADNPFTVGFRWLTAADERVCPICGPRHGEVRRKADGYSGGADIPAHTRCRCHEVPETEQTLHVPTIDRFVFEEQ